MYSQPLTPIFFSTSFISNFFIAKKRKRECRLVEIPDQSRFFAESCRRCLLPPASKRQRRSRWLWGGPARELWSPLRARERPPDFCVERQRCKGRWRQRR